ncbi:MAG: V-type ATP synthase subunit D [Oscillospiraceae bacterium]|nr:V-type ATP synthase subunit D [Oscillospiraceae bacterium]
MANNIIPTKGNLITTKKSLDFASVGYDLLDRKRNILVREMMAHIDKAAKIQTEIDETYAQAYRALQAANITVGSCDSFAETVHIDDGLSINFRSVMGVELPAVTLAESPVQIPFGLHTSTSLLDKAFFKFRVVKQLTAELAEVENSVYRLADAIKRTQKRANALKNIIIPQYVATVKLISETLDEREREEFGRLKVIKKNFD